MGGGVSLSASCLERLMANVLRGGALASSYRSCWVSCRVTQVVRAGWDPGRDAKTGTVGGRKSPGADAAHIAVHLMGITTLPATDLHSPGAIPPRPSLHSGAA